MVDFLLLVGIVILAAAVGEGVIEFIPVPLLEMWLPSTEENKPARTIILNSLSALLGIAIALNFNLGLFSMMDRVGILPWVDSILTGMLLGRGSNYIHAFITKFMKSDKEKEG